MKVENELLVDVVDKKKYGVVYPDEITAALTQGCVVVATATSVTKGDADCNPREVRITCLIVQRPEGGTT